MCTHKNGNPAFLAFVFSDKLRSFSVLFFQIVLSAISLAGRHGGLGVTLECY